MYCKAFHGEKDIADFTVELIFCNICPKTDCGLEMLRLRWVGCIPCADQRILFFTPYADFTLLCYTLRADRNILCADRIVQHTVLVRIAPW